MNKTIDYEKFLSRHDLIWNTYPRTIFEGPFMGNGETGIAMYFDSDNNLYVAVGNTNIYDNRTDEKNTSEDLFLTPRLPLGGFCLKTDGGFTDIDMRLSLYNARSTGILKTQSGYIEFSAFVVENESAFILEWTEHGASVEAVYNSARAVSPRQAKMLYENNTERMCKDYAEPKNAHDESFGTVHTHIQPKFCGGEYSITYSTFEDENKKTLVCVIGNTSGISESSVDITMPESIYKNSSALWSEHEAFWHDFYTKSFLSIDDTMIEGFYWIQLYKCASSTRIGKRVFDTAGPWLESMTSWPGTWWNLNVELNYSPLYPSNHLEISASLPENIKKQLPMLKNNVPAEYRNGEYCVIGRCTSASYSSPIGIPGVATRENDLEIGNLLWALHNCYVHFSSACDDVAIKEELFPVLKGSAEYIINFTYESEDGKLHLLPTCSPEYPGISADCNYNLSLLKWALGTLIHINKKYELCCAEAEHWATVLGRLTDFPYDEKEGYKIGADISLSMSHRHYSHLLMFYPLHIVDERDAAQREKVIKSIEHWHSMPDGLQGYSQSGAASMFAVLSDGNRAYKHLKNLFDGFINPNTMYDEGNNPVLETPPAAARSILDMVMLSFGDEIRIFSGTPDAWQNIAYSSLLCENGCEVSAVRENGKTVFAQITAKRDCTVQIKVDFCNGIKCDRHFEYKDGYIAVRIGKGESCTFSRENEERKIAPVLSDKRYENYFGLNNKTVNPRA